LFSYHNITLRRSAQHQPEKKRALASLPSEGRAGLRVEALGKVPFSFVTAHKAGSSHPVCLRDWDALFWASKRKVRGLARGSDTRMREKPAQSSGFCPFFGKQTCLPTSRKVTGAAKRIKSKIRSKANP